MRSHYLAEPATEELSARAAAKEQRRVELLRAAAEIMSDKGFHGTRLEEVGHAVGVSGPAVYRHFSGKEEILTELMTGISEHLLSEARRIVDGLVDPRERLAVLIDFQVDFALDNPALITVQDRDLGALSDADARQVRQLQRRYVEEWVAVLSRLDPGATTAACRARAHAVFGLINSTPHIGGRLDRAATAALLAAMAASAALSD